MLPQNIDASLTDAVRNLPNAGAGVRICRTLGTPSLRNLDPFLLLDEMRMPASAASAGFPSHPHRGFETCSIMFAGKMEHRDSQGNQVRALPLPVWGNKGFLGAKGLSVNHRQKQSHQPGQHRSSVLHARASRQSGMRLSEIAASGRSSHANASMHLHRTSVLGAGEDEMSKAGKG